MNGGGGGGAGSNLILAYAGTYSNLGSIENFGGEGGKTGGDSAANMPNHAQDGAAGTNLIVQIDA